MTSGSLYACWHAAHEHRTTCRSSLRAFDHHMDLIPDRVEAPHLDFLGAEIDRFMQSPSDGVLVINVPPGASKTLYVSRLLPALIFGRDPRARILAISATELLAAQSGAAIKGIIESSNYQQLFPHMAISSTSSSITNFAVTTRNKSPGVDRGTYKAFGVTGSYMGQRADVVLLDDVITVEAAANPVQLGKIHDTFARAILTRREKNTKIIHICQRLAPLDLAGWLVEWGASADAGGTGVRHIALPMEAEQDDPMGRAPGELLWPQHYSNAQIADARRDPMVWKTLYQQHPPSEAGAWCAPGAIQIVDVVPFAVPIYFGMDIALSLNSGDYTVIVVVAVDHQRNLFVLDAWRDRVESDKTVDKLIAMVRDHQPMQVFADDDNNMKAIKPLLPVMCRNAGIAVPLSLVKMGGRTKEQRAQSLSGWIGRRQVFFKRGDWNNWLLHQMHMFPNAVGNGVDDGVDALGLVAGQIHRLSRGPAPEAPRDAKPIGYSLDDLHADREATMGPYTRL